MSDYFEKQPHLEWLFSYNYDFILINFSWQFFCSWRVFTFSLRSGVKWLYSCTITVHVMFPFYSCNSLTWPHSCFCFQYGPNTMWEKQDQTLRLLVLIISLSLKLDSTFCGHLPIQQHQFLSELQIRKRMKTKTTGTRYWSLYLCRFFF